MSRMQLTVPDSLADYRGQLKDFFDGMLHKLHVNSHKNRPEVQEIPHLMFKMMGEMGELAEQLASDRFDPNSLEEAYDCANFAFLVFVALTSTGTGNPRKRKKANGAHAEAR